MTDIIIRNGKVVDGTGNPWFHGDVAIEGDRVQYVRPSGLEQAEGVEEQAARVIDARDKCVCPGFIDMHAHPDLTVFYKEVQDYKLRQGVTTEVSGNCGFTAAPVKAETQEVLKGYLAFITPPSGVSWRWRTFGDYLEAVRRSSPVTNLAPLVGQGTLRIAVMGLDRRDPTSQELRRMKGLVAEAMDAGAFGLSTGLVYVPGAYSDTREIVELAKVASRSGGIYATHMRDEGNGLLESVQEAIEIGWQADLPVQVSHHKAAGRANHGKVRESLALLDQAREQGLDITADQYPYSASSTTLQALLPSWAQEGGVDQIIRRLQDAQTRERIRGELLNVLGETGMGATLDNILVSSLATEANQRCIGLSIKDIGDIRNQDPVDVVFDLLVEESCAVGMVAFSMSEEDVRTVMAHPTTMIGTDGLFSLGKTPIPGSTAAILGFWADTSGMRNSLPWRRRCVR